MTVPGATAKLPGMVVKDLYTVIQEVRSFKHLAHVQWCKWLSNVNHISATNILWCKVVVDFKNGTAVN